MFSNWPSLLLIHFQRWDTTRYVFQRVYLCFLRQGDLSRHKEIKLQQEKTRTQEFHMYVQHCQSFRLREPIKITKCETIMKESRRQLLTHAWNEAKKRLHKNKNRITNIYLKYRKIKSPENYDYNVRVNDTSKDAGYQKSLKVHLTFIWKKILKNWMMKNKNANIEFRIINVPQ